MPALYLSEADVNQLLDMRLAIEAVEEAFRQLADRKACNVPRVRAKAPGVVLHTMSAAAEYLGLAGWKCYATTRAGARFHVGLYDSRSADLLAIIEAGRLGQLRTGATTAVAVEWMAVMGASELGMFGSGHQAETQLEAATLARPIKQAFVYSRSETKRKAFAERMSAQLKIDVVPVDRPQEAAEELPIVITATTSAEPLFDGNALSEGTLVCAMGSNWLNKAEIDTNVVRRADNIVCDSIAACRHEAGDFVAAIEKGVFDWSRAVELADVVSGNAVGRSNRDSVALFKSVGLAIEDVALGGKLLDLARAKGLGRELPF
ncbi:MAG TPA: ornithine cyclodeaminase family protein [Pirellulales bacterium]|jgi:ornithine cyclodeaminase/alanine dehydrogenase-like protein (mu-crystallin family)|nr:ornithine cyclodeaminase family protein [Pirellulales bacterium]